ncbi:sulfur globule protein CV1 [Gammaproteobacteria bacterium]|nr:sulfur globule protein CV1 [Gammaproteobacteria bacterium]
MKLLKKKLCAAAVACLLAVPFSAAHAWGTGPFDASDDSNINKWGNDGMGDGYGETSMDGAGFNESNPGYGPGPGPGPGPGYGRGYGPGPGPGYNRGYGPGPGYGPGYGAGRGPGSANAPAPANGSVHTHTHTHTHAHSHDTDPNSAPPAAAPAGQ